MKTKRQSPINSNVSIEDIKKNSQIADVPSLKRIYGGILLLKYDPCPIHAKKIWTQNRKTGLSATHYDEIQYTYVDNNHTYFDIQLKFILYVKIIM